MNSGTGDLSSCLVPSHPPTPTSNIVDLDQALFASGIYHKHFGGSGGSSAPTDTLST